MQGSYKSNGLPRPYYMKPSRKKRSPYDNLKEPIVFFNSPRRKLSGYLVMLIIFCTLMWWVSQDMKARPDVEYELETDIASSPSLKDNKMDNKNSGNLENIVKNIGSQADKEIENLDLADNLAVGSKGEKGLGAAEAPIGGMANEGPMIGNDEDKSIGSSGKSNNHKGQTPLKGNSPKPKDTEVVLADKEDSHIEKVGDFAKKLTNQDKAHQIIMDTQ
ncbi:hypothetical protein KGF56_003907 [Candida oxycetoniae]|uniref:Uncharacterized protein n=1 Tax=Candida oxycetoniae TaxID=497107 RepID=A0AAI9SUZ6_9ASCO|nr:uncharacterized protein KGF56_003907 [Candida oxycetoniae]KAI3403319.1 hypothetical protein KGF56_003907 [Candida oxycetoniae]